MKFMGCWLMPSELYGHESNFRTVTEMRLGFRANCLPDFGILKCATKKVGLLAKISISGNVINLKIQAK